MKRFFIFLFLALSLSGCAGSNYFILPNGKTIDQKTFLDNLPEKVSYVSGEVVSSNCRGLSNKGCYLPRTGQVLINNNLSKEETHDVFVHEAGHHVIDSLYPEGLVKQSPSKQEEMVHRLLRVLGG